MFQFCAVVEILLNISREFFDKDSAAICCKGKVKAIPVQAWRGPEACRRLEFPDFKTVVT